MFCFTHVSAFLLWVSWGRLRLSTNFLDPVFLATDLIGSRTWVRAVRIVESFTAVRQRTAALHIQGKSKKAAFKISLKTSDYTFTGGGAVPASYAPGPGAAIT